MTRTRTEIITCTTSIPYYITKTIGGAPVTITSWKSTTFISTSIDYETTTLISSTVEYVPSPTTVDHYITTDIIVPTTIDHYYTSVSTEIFNTSYPVTVVSDHYTTYTQWTTIFSERLSTIISSVLVPTTQIEVSEVPTTIDHYYTSVSTEISEVSTTIDHYYTSVEISEVPTTVDHYYTSISTEIFNTSYPVTIISDHSTIYTQWTTVFSEHLSTIVSSVFVPTTSTRISDILVPTTVIQISDVLVPTTIVSEVLVPTTIVSSYFSTLTRNISTSYPYTVYKTIISSITYYSTSYISTTYTTVDVITSVSVYTTSVRLLSGWILDHELMVF